MSPALSNPFYWTSLSNKLGPPIVILADFWASLLIVSAMRSLGLHHILTHLSLSVSFCLFHLECCPLIAKSHTFCRTQLQFYFMSSLSPNTLRSNIIFSLFQIPRLSLGRLSLSRAWVTRNFGVMLSTWFKFTVGRNCPCRNCGSIPCGWTWNNLGLQG